MNSDICGVICIAGVGCVGCAKMDNSKRSNSRGRSNLRAARMRKKLLVLDGLATQTTKIYDLCTSFIFTSLFVLLDCAPYSHWCSRAGRGLY